MYRLVVFTLLIAAFVDQHFCRNELSPEAKEKKIESIRQDCDKTFIAIRNNPSFSTMQEIYKDLPEPITAQNVMKFYDRSIEICKKYGSSESAPDEAHKQALIDSIPKSR
uniref:Uncharacterized protein n=1 Tax=Romanomermis culicivorax TaxID=13658 RepID=A0A915I585_ROMCU